MPNNNVGVIGTDGIYPIMSDGAFAIFNIAEIYNGGPGANRYIPKINDLVIDITLGIFYKVVDINQTTFIPTLTKMLFEQDTSSASELLVSDSQDSRRVYYDKTVSPNTLTPDSFIHTYSATATFARIYRGKSIDPDKLISRVYNNSGQFVGTDIPLSVVAFNTHDNYAIKSVPACNCTTDLINGEDCTIIVYSSDGKVVSKINCIIEETTYIAQAYAEQRTITQIFLKSAFVPATGTNEINYPVNLPIQSFNPIGVVQYNDGTQIEYPVDGTKFSLYGLDQFVSTVVGHKVPLVLSYRLDPGESSVSSVYSDGYKVTRPYELVVSNANRSYNVKLYIYPVWMDQITGYSYKAFLMNLDRNILFDVTSKVMISPNSPAFNPLAYGTTQRITFAVELSSVNPMYSTYLHSQVVDIILRAPGNEHSATNLWEVGNQVPTTVPYYGTNLRATLGVDSTSVTIANGITTVSEFLDKVYRTTNPIYDPEIESAGLVPTHFEIRYLGEAYIHPIENFTMTFHFNNPLTRYKNVEIVFLKQTVTGMKNLSISSMTLR